ncbi:lysylphosphatidylglycerol synthase transmembrane domain-containing protein [Tunturiibacter lichenicola]|uniref:lysylphosphatidylglycerol synthase transmembrane domain-containing protein n=1 Tax=Tunturiibacter lichenicola TaxID=2051959 RepID=UPI0021B2B0F3|nr:lysylphosphatidylglycerol synthase transmembrane domain-containing protein [Edaphobacter lichenicola]
MSATPTTSNGRNMLKTVPGVFISIFFLWYTFRGISFSQILALRITHPAWILGILGFTVAGYTLRCLRWTQMMPRGRQSIRTHFLVCARVLMTSLAANNILPLRIGDIMRIFTYADDLGTSPSIILSTVILEKLLDIFILVLMFVSTVGTIATPRLRLIANISLAISAIGLLTLLVAARILQPPIQRLFTRLPANPKLEKIEHWITLALDATGRLGVTGSLLLLLQTVVIWACEGMIFLSAIRLLGLPVDRIAAWLAVSFANLSYLIPSSPGAIGPFELTVKTSLVNHGASISQAAVFGLAIHAWMLISVTGAGGIIFLIHRFHIQNHKPLLEEIEQLPVELP